MNLLYAGNYTNRFTSILAALKNKGVSSVVELCFGDVIIAEYCKTNHIQWQGFDLNDSFVKYARNKGYAAELADVVKKEDFPAADIYIIAGSLYHFTRPELKQLLTKILLQTNLLIISEPVKNISSNKGLVGDLARRLSRTSKNEVSFRYTHESLSGALEDLKTDLDFNFKTIGYIKKDLVILIEKNGRA